MISLTATDTDGMAWYPTGPLAASLTRWIGPTRRGWTACWLDWLAESRAHRVICLLMGIWLLNGFDLAFTILSHEQGVLHEENPFARHMLQFGTVSIILYKIGMVLVGSYPLLRFRAARITELGTLVILAAYAFLAFRWSVCYELYSFTATNTLNMAEITTAGGLVPN